MNNVLDSSKGQREQCPVSDQTDAYNILTYVEH